MGSQLATWSLTLISTVVIPRYLGAELIGRLQLATAVWAMGLAVIEFGMDLAMTKTVARDHTRIGPTLATSVVTRLLIGVPVTLVLFAYAFLIGYADQIVVLLAIVGARTLFQAVSGSATSVLMGIEDMGPVSVAAIAGRALSLCGGLAALALGRGVYMVAAFGVAGVVLNLLVQLRALQRARRRIPGSLPLGVDRAAMVGLLRESLPYLWITLFMIVYQQIDTIVISIAVEDDRVLGWYTVYDRLAGTLMFVPTVFMSAVYPALSRLYAGGEDGGVARHNQLTARSFRLMLLISVPLGFGLSTIARPVIELLYGDEFSQAGQVMAVGGLVISLTYLTTVMGMFLISMDRQREWTRVMVLGVLLTIPLDLVLVPWCQDRFDNGAIGGALAYAITESVILAGSLRLLPRGALGPGSAGYAARAVLGGLIMMAAVFPLRDLFLVVPVAAGAVVFGASVFLLRLTTPDDRQLALDLLPDRLVPWRS